ncbi:Interleukin-4 receptor subunit alpha [Varanus komodoensis]|nr:Interleukin-4 receptor subunit alpha [Varanus komodoensis]
MDTRVGDVQPSCVTDLATALVCHWDVDASVNCTKEFQLLYRTDDSQPFSECVPENEHGPGAASTCSCVITGNKFSSVKYDLQLYRMQICLSSTTVNPEDIAVKPRPLVNLTLEKKRKARSFVLTWQTDYKPGDRLYKEDVTYQVTYWPKDQREKEQNYTVQSPCYEIFADRLVPEATYVAAVRYQLVWWVKTWSEWSTPCEWHNDFERKPEDVLWKSIYWLSAPVVAIILTCYLCFLRVKRDWWDRIPSPAKSKMVEATARAFPVVQKGDGRTAFRGTWKLNALSKRSAVLAGPAAKEKTPQDGPGGKPEVFLTPEVALVECPLLMYSRAPATKGEALDRGEQGGLPREDPVASLFDDLLNGDWHSGSSGSCEPPTWGQEPGPLRAAPHLPLETPVEEHSCRAAGGGLETTSETGLRMEPATSPKPGSPPLKEWPEYGASFPEAQPEGSAPNPADPLLGTVGRGHVEGYESRSGTSMASQSGYRCFSSLVAQPMVGSSQGWEHGVFPPQGDQLLPQCSCARPCLDSWPADPQPDLPGDQAAGWLSPGRVATTGLGFPAVPGGRLEAPLQDVPGKPGHASCPAASLSAGYKPFSTALQSSTASGEPCSLALESPYRPLLMLRNGPAGNPGFL